MCAPLPRFLSADTLCGKSMLNPPWSDRKSMMGTTWFLTLAGKTLPARWLLQVNYNSASSHPLLQENAEKEQAASQAPHAGREQLKSAVKRRRLVKKPAEAAATAPAKAAVSAGGVALEDLPLAQRVGRPPAASKAALARRKAAAPKAGSLP